MTNKTAVFLLLSLLLFSCSKPVPVPVSEPEPTPLESAGSDITYQLLVYSFADSDGDGVGDFKGIENRLDYLREMGIQALWLSPIHPATSYHGYDVEDYSDVNPQYGTMDDFNSLLRTAHEKGMKIYIDFVLNHSSREHPWFTDAKNDAYSKYRDYYIISENPKADLQAGRFPMLKGMGYNSGEWFQTAGDSWEAARKVRFTLRCNSQDKPESLMIEEVETVINSGSQNSGKWLWWGDPGRNTQFYSQGGHVYTLSLELDSPWGVLIRTSTSQWDSYKYGAPAGGSLMEWGVPLKLSNTDNSDILLPGMSQQYYYAMFGSYMPDLNYGAVEECEKSPAFAAMCEAADKWIMMGVDGFRLDAVKHIYPNADNGDNPTFLRKFHDHCNATYRQRGGDGTFYMVGEQFSEAEHTAPYYYGIPALFEFSYYWRLTEAINNADGRSFVATLQNYRNLYAGYRSDYIAATKLSNHDEDRAGSTLGRSIPKMKLAGAMLLTCDGEPYIYQGEELGYWGTKSSGDEYVRTPMMWKGDGSDMADKALDRIDRSMLTSSISVESQLQDPSSILNLYRQLGTLRTQYKALAAGSLGYCASAASNSQVVAWYREYDGQKILVVHNLGAGQTGVSFSGDSLTEKIWSNGTVSVKDSKVTLGAYASAIFLL